MWGARVASMRVVGELPSWSPALVPLVVSRPRLAMGRRHGPLMRRPQGTGPVRAPSERARGGFKPQEPGWKPVYSPHRATQAGGTFQQL